MIEYMRLHPELEFVRVESHHKTGTQFFRLSQATGGFNEITVVDALPADISLKFPHLSGMLSTMPPHMQPKKTATLTPRS